MGKNEKKLICPRCGNQLYSHNYVDFVVETCNNCGGVWFDKWELSRLITYFKVGIKKELDTIPFKWMSKEIDKYETIDGVCPKDGGHLSKYVLKIEEITLDIFRCDVCNGLWFDKGLLFKLYKSLSDKNRIDFLK